MKKVITKTLIVTCGLALGASAYAAKTGTTQVLKVSTGSTGNVFVTTANQTLNPAGCTFNSSYMIDSNDPILKTYMAILLTARAGSLNVNLAISDDECVNSGKYPKIANAEIQ